MNCRSVKSLVTCRALYILTRTETWLGTSADAQVLSELVSPGYEVLHVSRPDKRGGGVAVLFKQGLGLETVNNKDDVFTQK